MFPLERSLLCALLACSLLWLLCWWTQRMGWFRGWRLDGRDWWLGAFVDWSDDPCIMSGKRRRHYRIHVCFIPCVPFLWHFSVDWRQPPPSPNLVCPGHGPHGQGPRCCARAGEYNGYQSGPLLFQCPQGCSCHD